MEKALYLSGDNGYTAKIQDAINRTKKEFIYIGMLLCEVDSFGYYKEAGFENVYDYCEVTFGFKRSSTNNFMRVYRQFGEAMSLKEAYKRYSYSQLTEMCSMNGDQLSQCKPEYSVQKLRELKRGNPSPDRVPSGTSSVQTSGLEIHCSLHSYQIPAWLVTKMHYLFGGFDRDKVFDALDSGLVALYGCEKGYINIYSEKA